MHLFWCYPSRTPAHESEIYCTVVRCYHTSVGRGGGRAAWVARLGICAVISQPSLPQLQWCRGTVIPCSRLAWLSWHTWPDNISQMPSFPYFALCCVSFPVRCEGDLRYKLAESVLHQTCATQYRGQRLSCRIPDAVGGRFPRRS